MYCYRTGNIFWVDFTNDYINRATGIESPNLPFTTLVTGGMACVGESNSRFKIH